MNSFPWLTLLIVVPLVGAVVTAALPAGHQARLPKQVAFGASLLTLVLAVVMSFGYHLDGGFQFTEEHTWIQAFGAHYAVGVDGLGLLMVLLTAVLVPIVIGAAWYDADPGARFRLDDDPPESRHTKAFFAWTLALEAFSVAVFAATDVFLFYVVFEATLIPAYFLIGGFGGGKRRRAAVKFLIYQLAGGLIMLGSVIGLYVVSAHHGSPSYLLSDLSGLSIDPTTQKWLFVGFFIAFAVKAPLFPVHTWLPDTTEQATPATSVLLVCILDKIGAFAMLRYCLGILPDASRWATPVVITLALISIVYGALVALGQDDMLRLFGFMSISHFGFIVLGIFVLTTQGGSGAVLYMVNHGLGHRGPVPGGGLPDQTAGHRLDPGDGRHREGRAGPGRAVPGLRPRRSQPARPLAVRLRDPGPDRGLPAPLVDRCDRRHRDRDHRLVRPADVPAHHDRARADRRPRGGDHRPRPP